MAKKKKRSSADAAFDKYLENVRLYVWYQKSDFSFFPGKHSPELSEKHRKLASHHFDDYMKKRSRGSAEDEL